ncbi:MAG: Dam family site-specific DNA-(adenine-N6)-methyltransferase [Mobilibacterium timonense]|uniref:DNA adenine methylase n=1 Tax=Mobilibacterium timonense TaxID=1871012 RepID=UPI00235253E4|nr:Dam family site-specific DNA-(adenine-N6)-methyltransferase [Mobilibacterium timonense]MBM6990721.1 Dam family site-specific DNA-(adenine-N6)-methyltransferase [Mobilibacterium timonense]
MAEAFLRWAGGKRWFIQKESHRLPNAEQYKRYIEPFLGGGSVFFYLEPKHALLSDYNEELIRAYIALRDNFDGIYHLLEKHQINNSKDYYYRIRNTHPTDPVDAAARTIYLNKACFNGIYRVNKSGEFNVPYGKRDVINFVYQKLKDASIALKGIDIVAQPYGTSIDEAEEGDFLFCDPPYALETAESFVGYNADSFTWEDQVQLADSLQKAADRGVKVMVTNVDAPEVRALYDEATFLIDNTSRNCRIAGGLEGRKVYPELIATANI